jgi:hypothetical protein
VVRGMRQGKIERIEEEGEALAHRWLRNWPGTSAVWQNLGEEFRDILASDLRRGKGGWGRSPRGIYRRPWHGERARVSALIGRPWQVLCGGGRGCPEEGDDGWVPASVR